MRKTILIAMCAVICFNLVSCAQGRTQLPEDKPADEQQVAVQPYTETDALSDYIGKTAREIETAFGKNFEFSSYQGSTLMRYTDRKLDFFLETYSNTPSGYERIIGVWVEDSVKLAGKLYGNMTYNEIFDAIGDTLAIPEPQRGYIEMYDRWQYNSHFVYEGCEFSYVWYDDPKTTPCEYVYISKRLEEKPVLEEIIISEEEAEEKLKNRIGDLGTWISGMENVLTCVGLHTCDGKKYYQFRLTGWAIDHPTTLTWFVISADGKEMFEGQCIDGKMDKWSEIEGGNKKWQA